MKKFKLQNLALYAKNHYKRSNNIWRDLTRVLYADGYDFLQHSLIERKYEKASLTRIVLNAYLDIPNKLNKNVVMRMITEGINPQMT